MRAGAVILSLLLLARLDGACVPEAAVSAALAIVGEISQGPVREASVGAMNGWRLEALVAAPPRPLAVRIPNCRRFGRGLCQSSIAGGA